MNISTNKRMILSLFVLFSFMAIYSLLNFFGVFSKSYKSIELAIKNSDLRDYIVLTTLEDNDCVYALVGRDGHSQWAYFYRDTKGWQYIFDKINIPKKLVIKGDYDLSIRWYRGKDIINISVDEKYSEVLNVRDSMNSNFKTYKSDYSKYYFLVFDKLPENYIIYIGEDEYKIN